MQKKKWNTVEFFKSSINYKESLLNNQFLTNCGMLNYCRMWHFIAFLHWILKCSRIFEGTKQFVLLFRSHYLFQFLGNMPTEFQRIKNEKNLCFNYCYFAPRLIWLINILFETHLDFIQIDQNPIYYKRKCSWQRQHSTILLPYVSIGNWNRAGTRVNRVGKLISLQDKILAILVYLGLYLRHTSFFSSMNKDGGACLLLGWSILQFYPRVLSTVSCNSGQLPYRWITWITSSVCVSCLLSSQSATRSRFSLFLRFFFHVVRGISSILLHRVLDVHRR